MDSINTKQIPLHLGLPKAFNQALEEAFRGGLDGPGFY